MTELRLESLAMVGAPLGPENPLPFFRDQLQDRPVHVQASVPAEKRQHLGWQAGFRVLPYRMQDTYSRERVPLTFQTIVLENAQLKATFLPELGGRLISLVHKPLQRELLARNPVFQPANLAIRNAWFAGGIEWNIGQFGHTFHTCAPIFAATIRGAQGEPGLRFYEFERCKRLFWQIDLYLPPDSPLLIAYTRVINPNDEEASMYWWTNIAVPEQPDLRVLVPARDAIYIDFAEPIGYGYTSLPNLPSLGGNDGTYPRNSTFANEFFFQCDQADIPWEAAVDGEGKGLFEASTGRMRYRKLFCWGTHPGGRRWQEFLARPGFTYAEIQAGLAPTQLHGLPMPGNSSWDWTQVFGYIEANARGAHSDDWATATQTVDQTVRSLVSAPSLREIEVGCRQRADRPGEDLLARGSGWGALELKRRSHQADAIPIPPAFVFPDETLGPEQHKWLTLLQHGSLGEQDPALEPGDWMVQPEWHALLQASLASPHGVTWFALLHAGVMRLEQGDVAGAEAAWNNSLAHQPSVWAYRNLAVLAQRQGNLAAALSMYENAWQLASAAPFLGRVPALAQEYLQALYTAGQFEQAQLVYDQLPLESKERDRIQILHGKIALALGKLDIVDQVLQRDYAVIQEGETDLTCLWFDMWTQRQALQTGRPIDSGLRQEVMHMYPPPQRIDFRLVDK